MPPNNRSRSSRQRLPTDLEARYGKIGIPAVVAAARIRATVRERAARSKTLAGPQPIKNQGSHRRSNPETTPVSRRRMGSGFRNKTHPAWSM
jgi:hypothetical protein